MRRLERKKTTADRGHEQSFAIALPAPENAAPVYLASSPIMASSPLTTLVSAS